MGYQNISRKRTVNIGKPTKELNGISLTMLGMRHSFCRKRSANGPRSPSMSAFGTKRRSRRFQYRCLDSYDPPDRDAHEATRVHHTGWHCDGLAARVTRTAAKPTGGRHSQRSVTTV